VNDFSDLSTSILCVQSVWLKAIFQQHATSYVERLTLRGACVPERYGSLQAGLRKVALVPNSTTRTPATDMLYNTTNGRAHNNSTTCCTTNSPDKTNKNLPHPNILTCRDVGLWHCDVANFCPLVVLYNMSVAGVRVVEFGSYGEKYATF